jgi:cellulose synthase/poly-beta-1,6-N-acetylglucosamine synthase-like glycosyltransferase
MGYQNPLENVKLPFISCKCITYGRVGLLEESLYSFLNQKYDGESEMIIVNDYPHQKLYFEHPKVKIYNLDTTFQTIGEKENFAVSKCSGDLIAVWDDDDIGLPNHLYNIAKYFQSESNLLHWQRGVYYNEPNITAITSLGNSGIVYSKKGWEMVGGHPLENAGYDVTFVNKLMKLSGKVITASPPDEEVSWFYMWGGRDYHMSGMGTDTPDRENVIIRHERHIERLRKMKFIPTGDIELKPKWKKDYQQLLFNFIKKEKYGN